MGACFSAAYAYVYFMHVLLNLMHHDPNYYEFVTILFSNNSNGYQHQDVDSNIVCSEQFRYANPNIHQPHWIL